MTIGYQRQSVASIVNGNVINDSDFNNEYNAILAAYDKTTGHNHDGITVGGGAPILAVNGVSFPASPSTNTVPVVTGANTITYEVVPNAALAHSTMVLGGTTLTLGSTTTTVDALTLTNATISGSLSSVTLASPTITGTATFTGATLANGTYTGSTLTAPTINAATITGAVAFSGTATGGTYAGATFTTATISTGSLGSAVTGATQGTGNNTGQIATTAFVQNVIGTLSLGTASTHATGFFLQTANNLSDVTASTARTNLGLGTAATHADTDYAQTFTGLGDRVGFYTNGAGGTLVWTRAGSGVAQVWTEATLTNNNQLSNGSGYITSSALTPYAPLASPALTGTPTAPTAAGATNTTQIATTAFVQTSAASVAIGQTYGSLRSYELFQSSTVFVAGTSYDGASVGQSGGQTWLCMGCVALGGGFTATLLLRTA